MLDIAYFLFCILVASGIAAALFRLWKGPTVADRLNAADVVAICCVGLAVGHGWRQGDGIWLDFAMVAGLVLFVGTTAVSLFIDPEDLSDLKDLTETEK